MRGSDVPMNFSKAPPNMSGPPEGDEVDLVSTHQRLLVGAALRTTGDILEMGCGWYSTPILHEIAMAQERRLWTFDNQADWLPQFNQLACNFHRMYLVGRWPEMYELLDKHHFPVVLNKAWHFGLAFLDHGQPIEREYAVRRLLEEERVDVFVMHDTEELVAYGYQRTLPMFKYQFTDMSQKAFTTCASNVVDVRNWFDHIKERRLTEDVT